MANHLNRPSQMGGEEEFEKGLRPKRLSEFVGQKEVVDQLAIAVQAASERKEQMDHILLYGPPGLGKTTLAYILAAELGVNLHTTTGPAMERKKDIASILTNLDERDILFIDEIHRLNRSVEETLYPAMEDYALDIIIGQGPSAKTLRLDVPHFTLIGATTRAGMLTGPLRDRFGIINRLDFYGPEDLALITMRDADVLGIGIDKPSALEISRRSRGTPRIAIRLLKRVRDYAQVKGDGSIGKEITHYALEKLKIDAMGLDDIDKRILRFIIEKYDGGPVGIDTLAIALSEARETLEDVYEPYLIQIGFLKRTSRGRVVSRSAVEYLGLTLPSAADSLF
ncbi:Holliday junction branch migration DNA helicase RuvB [bacterium]|nr:Holliday junction branch migration DNA helicase RuvB [bacterium]